MERTSKKKQGKRTASQTNHFIPRLARLYLNEDKLWMHRGTRHGTVETLQISKLVRVARVVEKIRTCKLCLVKSVSTFFLLPLRQTRVAVLVRATYDTPVVLVRKLIAAPPRFNSIIQVASCRCKFHPRTLGPTLATFTPPRSPDPRACYPRRT